VLRPPLSQTNRWLRPAPLEVRVDGRQPIIDEALQFPGLAVMVGSDGSSAAGLSGAAEGGSRLPVLAASEGLECRVASVAVYDGVLSHDAVALLLEAGPAHPCLGFPVAAARKVSSFASGGLRTDLHLPGSLGAFQGGGFRAQADAKNARAAALQSCGVIACFHARFGRLADDDGAYLCPGWRPTGSMNLEKVTMGPAPKPPLAAAASWPEGVRELSSGDPVLLLRRGVLCRGGADLLDACYAVGGAALPLGLTAALVDEARKPDGKPDGKRDEPRRLVALVDLVAGAVDHAAALVGSGDGRFVSEWLQLHGFHALAATLGKLPAAYLGRVPVAAACGRLLAACRPLGDENGAAAASAALARAGLGRAGLPDALVGACLQGLCLNATLWARPMLLEAWATTLRCSLGPAAATPHLLLDAVGCQALLDALVAAAGSDIVKFDAVLRAAQPLLFIMLRTALSRPVPLAKRPETSAGENRGGAARSFMADNIKSPPKTKLLYIACR